MSKGACRTCDAREETWRDCLSVRDGREPSAFDRWDSIPASIMFLTTLSFLVTTPNQSPDAQSFPIKDFFLPGAAIWIAGEALQASTRTSKP